MPFARLQTPGMVYRVAWGDEPLGFVPHAVLRDPNRKPGRWDPHDFSYRVLYTADVLQNAFIEILYDFKPRPQAQAILDGVQVTEQTDRTVVDMDSAITAYLLPRYAASIIVPHPPHLVRIDEHPSRQMIAEALEIPPFKIGDLIASDPDLSRSASQVVYRDNEIGLACSSALVTDGINYCFFERPSEEWSTDLVPHVVAPALNEQIALRAALKYLGLEP